MATKRNIGAALPQPQISTITIANTWAAGDIATVTINNKIVSMTCGSTMDTTAEVAAGLKEVLGLSTHDPASISADCTTTYGGYEFAEFRDATYTVSGSVVTCTSVGAMPFTMTSGETTAGTGTASYAVATAASGPNFFMGNNNWEGGAEPDDDDTVVFDGASASIYYGLNNALADLNITTTADYTGDIGLPKINARGYTEYRQRFLDATVTVTTGVQAVILDGTGRRYIDFSTAADASNNLTVTVINASANSSDGPAVQLVGGKNMEFVSHAGTISLSDHIAENLTNIQSIKNLGNAYVTVGTAATFVDVANSIEHNGGTLDFDAACNGAATETRIFGGTFIARENTDLDAYHQYGGVCDWRGVTLDTPVLYGGTFDGSNCTVTGVSGNFRVFKGVTFIDPNRVLLATSTLGLVGCSVSEVNLKLKSNLTLSFTTTVAPSIG